MGLNRYGAGGGVGSGAQPQKPEVAIHLRAILITKTVVAGFRGEKNERKQAYESRTKRKMPSLPAVRA